jgi:hypothetical protein
MSVHVRVILSFNEFRSVRTSECFSSCPVAPVKYGQGLDGFSVFTFQRVFTFYHLTSYSRTYIQTPKPSRPQRWQPPSFRAASSPVAPASLLRLSAPSPPLPVQTHSAHTIMTTSPLSIGTHSPPPIRLPLVRLVTSVRACSKEAWIRVSTRRSWSERSGRRRSSAL